MRDWCHAVTGPLIAGTILVGCGTTSSAVVATEARAGAVATTVVGLDTMKFNPEAISVKAGTPLVITFRNAGIIVHDLVTVGGTENAKLVNVGAGKSQNGTFLAEKPGTYRIVCAQPGHPEAGMIGKIIVE